MPHPDLPHHAEWTEEKIQDYWNWLGKNQYVQECYFSYRVGQGVIRCIADAGLLHGTILDFGCGTGHLLNELLNQGLSCQGTDSSITAVGKVNKKFEHMLGWLGAERCEGFTTQFPDHRFDLIVCLETLEHLEIESIPSLFHEFQRLLKPGGVIFLSVPYSENMEKETIYCPFCQSLFHRWQHLHSFTQEKLSTWITNQNFEIIAQAPVDFAQFQKNIKFPRITQLNLSNLFHWTRFRMLGMLDRLLPRTFPFSRTFCFRMGKNTPTHFFAIASPGKESPQAGKASHEH